MRFLKAAIGGLLATFAKVAAGQAAEPIVAQLETALKEPRKDRRRRRGVQLSGRPMRGSGSDEPDTEHKRLQAAREAGRGDH